jgi:hypothetical protein
MGLFSTAAQASDTPPANSGDLFERLFDPNLVQLSEELLEEVSSLPEMYESSIGVYENKITEPMKLRQRIHQKATELLESEDTSTRRKAAQILLTLKDNKAIPVMIEFMGVADPNDRIIAATSLAQVNTRDDRITQAFIKALEDDSIEVKLIAVEKLGELRQRDLIPKFIEMLKDPDLSEKAALALEKIKLGYFDPYTQKSEYGADYQKWSDWWAWENIDGTEVVVRVHKNPGTHDDTYEKTSVKVKHHSITFDSLPKLKGAIITIHSADQTNGLLKRCYENRAYAIQFPDTGGIGIPRWDYNVQPVRKWLLVDAMGYVIENAKVELYRHDHRGLKVKYDEVISDDGTLAVPYAEGGLQAWEFVLHHENYGIAASPEPIGDDLIHFPLIHDTSVAVDRALTAVVLDRNGVPVPGLPVVCRSASIKKIDAIYSAEERCAAITDENGRFRYYVPINEYTAKTKGKVIPLNTFYTLRIIPDDDTGLPPLITEVENGEERVLFLEESGNPHTFEFYDGEGLIEGEKGLQYVTLKIKRGDGVLRLNYEDWSKKKLFPNGTYIVEFDSGWRTGQYKGRKTFEAVEVTDESPKKIVFKLPQAVTYTGRVIDGRTSLPIVGAYATTMLAIAPGRLADISEEQWEKIHRLGNDMPLDDPALEPIKKTFEYDQIVRTDENGYYTITTEPGIDFYSFFAFEENYIPVSKRVYPQKPGEPLVADVETIRLYPAARICLNVIADEDHMMVQPRWQIDKENSPQWASELMDYEDGRTVSMQYYSSFDANKTSYVFVPAYAYFTLKLNCPYNEIWAPITFDEAFYLEPSQLLDLGKIPLEKSLTIYVKAVNSANEPVIGISLRRRIGNSGGHVHITDENGIATFYLPQNTKGSFFATDYSHRSDGTQVIEELNFQVGGPEDDNIQYVMQLSDELIYYMLGRVD